MRDPILIAISMCIVYGIEWVPQQIRWAAVIVALVAGVFGCISLVVEAIKRA